MMSLLFINLSISDVIDILLVAYLIYTFYTLVRGTAALNIFVGLISIYFIWKLVGMLQMRMLDEILGQFISVGVIALIIVFQQEIRSFLVMLGKLGTEHNKYFRFLRKIQSEDNTVDANAIIESMVNMSKTLTGALIVITRTNELKEIVETGEEINGRISSALIETIFYKNNPLHDGAIVITNNKIIAARCVLPVSKSPSIPADYGLRHRASVGVTQNTDSLSIIVSEQTGHFAYSEGGELFTNVSIEDIRAVLEKKEE